MNSLTTYLFPVCSFGHIAGVDHNFQPNWPLSMPALWCRVDFSNSKWAPWSGLKKKTKTELNAVDKISFFPKGGHPFWAT